MQEKSALLEAALRYAEAGIPIFPCEPDSKKPREGSSSFHEASTDPDVIRGWWKDKAYNIAFSPAAVGWGILDPDGEEGLAALAKLEDEFGKLPETFTVRSPRGGLHYYFNTVLPTTAWAPGRKRCVGDHIDTRGAGSYALLPPSTFEGKPYVAIKEIDLAEAPDWILERTRRPDQRVTAVATGLDQPANIVRARAFLRDLVQRGHLAVEGRGGNNTTYSVACDVLDLGLTPETAIKLIAEIWNPECQPPWSEEELERIIANATAYSENDAGASASAPASEVFAAALDKLPAEAKQERPSYFHPYSVEEQDAGPEDEEQAWQVPDMIPDEATVLLVGAKGSFKSFISHHLGLMLASNNPTMGLSVRRPGPFFYAAHEGWVDLKKRRRKAWEFSHQPAKPYPFYLMRGPHIISEEECRDFVEEIKKQAVGERPSGIVLDTLAKCMLGLEENDVRDAGRLVAFCDMLVREFRCPVIVDHHKAKDGRPGGRGSGAIEAGFSTVLDLERPNMGRAVELRVRYHKDAQEPSEPWTFEVKPVLHSIILQETTATEHRAIVHAADVFDPRKIGAALAALLAYGRDKAVSTDVLASEVAPVTEEQDDATRAGIVTRTVRTLNGLGRLGGKLEAYCDREGREKLWYLPQAQSDLPQP